MDFNLTEKEQTTLRDSFYKVSDGLHELADLINSGVDVPIYFKIDYNRLKDVFDEFDGRYELGKRL